MSMRKLFGVLTLAGAVAATGQAMADGYPNKPIEIIVPFSAGGSTDVTMRMLAPKVSELLKQPVVIVNKPGATGTIGAAAVAHAKPDGYTLLATTMSFPINATLNPNLTYDTVADFAAVIKLTAIPNVMVVNPKLGVKTVAELVAKSKQSGEPLNYASAGIGTVGNLGTELLKTIFGMELTHIPYKGNAGVKAAIVAGEVPVGLAPVPAFIGHINSGALVPLVVTTATRVDALPDTPTVAELGHDGFDVASWQGVLAPAGTPAEAVNALNAAFAEVLKQPEIQEKVKAQGGSVVASTPEKYATDLKKDVAMWADVIKKAGLKK